MSAAMTLSRSRIARKFFALLVALSLLFSVLAQVGFASLQLPDANAAVGDLGVSSHEGQLKAGDVVGAYSDGAITEYGAGDEINFRLTLTNAGAGPASGDFVIEWSGDSAACQFFEPNLSLGVWNDEAAPAVVPVSGAPPTVSLVGVPQAVAEDWVQQIHVDFPEPGSAAMHYYLKLSADAVSCDGSVQYSRTGNAPSAAVGDFGDVSVQSIPVPADSLVRPPAEAPAAPAAPVADLSVSVDDGVESVLPGETVVYAVGFGNAGPSDSSNVTLTAVVPANTVFDPVSSSPGWVEAGGEYSLVVGDLAADGSGDGSVDFAVTVAEPFPDGVDDVISVVSLAGDYDDDGATASHSTTVEVPVSEEPTAPAAPVADLSVSVDDGVESVLPGETVVYAVGFGNAGPSDSSNVTLTAAVPANTVFDPVSSSPGWVEVEGAAQKYSLVVGDLAADGSGDGSVDFAVTVAEPFPDGVDDVTSVVSVAGDYDDDGATASHSTTVEVPVSEEPTAPAAPVADLSVSVDDGVESVLPGETVVYAVGFGNAGPSDSSNVTLTAAVPANTVFDPVSSSPGWVEVEGAAQKYTLAVGDLAADGSGDGSVDFAVIVADPFPDGVDDVTSVVSVAGDYDADGATASDSTPVEALAPELWTTDASGNPRLDFAPNETVYIHGSGFTPGTAYAIPVTRPDGSIVKGDGTFALGWDTTTTDSEGNLYYEYILNGIEGPYEINTYVDPWAGPGSSDPVVASFQFTDSGGDFDTIDFAAAAPFTYTHSTGGGAWNDGTIGKTEDVVESLEGGDFACFEQVTFLTRIVVDDTPDDANQTVQLDYSFLADTTGQSGAALYPVTTVGVNYGAVENGGGGGVGTYGTDLGIIADDGGSTATIISTGLTGPLFQSGSETLLTVEIDDLEAGEEIIVRIDVEIACDLDANPTGNLQAQLNAGRVVDPVEDTISTGEQTIPFKKIGRLLFPGLNIIKTVMETGGTCGVDDVDELTVAVGDEVTYCYVVTNDGSAPLLNLTAIDDNATPGNSSDDFPVALSPLTDEDSDGNADDLAAGASTYGESGAIAVSAAGTRLNVVTATGDDNGDTLTDADDALVNAVGAKIEITPLTADNVVGDPHVLTATVSQDTGGGYVAAANETVTFTVTAGAATFIEAGSDATAAPWNTCVTDAAGQCSVVIVSNTTGSNTIKAASDVLVGTATVSVETDGTGDNSPPADKDYVGAKIEITPLTADNVVGDPHVLTATVSQDTGGGYVAAANETVTFTVTAGAATFIEAGSDATAAPWNTCVTDAAGQCSVVIVSNTTGSNTIKAASDVLVGTATVSVETDGTGDNSPPADKDYVGAKIEITPLTADNVVGDPHVLTATVSQDTGGGYVAAANETVTFTVTAGAATFIEAGSDATAAPWNTCVTDAAGQCSVVIVSNTTGSNTIKAASDVLVGTATVSVETDGTGDNSPPADKDYVGAKIEITPLTADNVVGDPHVLTATVSQDTGGGYVAAANETVTFTVTAGAATFIEAGSDATAAPWNTCVTDAAGQCSVVIVSNTTGSNTIKAASDVLVGTATVSVETDGTGDNSPPADKDYVGAKIEITPLTADNVVGDPHVLTATVSQDTGGGYVAAANETVTFTVTAGAATFIEAGSDATAAPWNTCVTDAAGQCSVVIVSNTTGSNTIKAASDVLVGTATVSVETDGTGDNSPPADKDYVGAKIEITPLTADNVVGDPHVLTATVSQDTGGGYVAAANETVTFTVTAGAATFIEAGSDATAAPWNTCVTDAAGQCSVVIVSNTTGSNTIKAASDVLVGTATVSVETDGTGDNSPPADKDYVGAKIEITPLTADNVVGDPHVLTATVSQDTGGGYVAAANETVTFTVTAGAATFIEAGSDATAAPWNTCVTDAAGQCSVVIVSNTTGSNTIKAASDVLVGTATVSVETDGTGDNSPPADKDYVGAKIEITPLTADNVVGDPHVLTATVSQDTGGGYVAAANETVTFTVTAGAATFIEAGSDATAAPWNTCVTDAAGQCSVVIVSNTTGSNTIKAASDVLVGTATVSVETDGTGDNSPPADKDYVGAKIEITPLTADNVVGDPHVLTATVSQDTGGGYVAAANETVTFTVTAGAATFIEAGSDATAAPWNTCVTDAAGQCSVVIVSNTTGSNTIKAASDVLVGTATVSVETDGTGDNSPPADKDYVGAKIEITPLTADNVVGDPHVLTATVSQDTGGGYVAAANETVTFTVTAGAATFIEAGSDATAAPWNTCVTDAAGQCSVVIVSNTTGSNTIKAASDVLVGTATVSVETDGTGDNSPPADKDYVGAKIEITPLTADNVVGDPHVLTATVSQDTGGGYVAAANETVTFTVTAGAATFIEAGSDATAAPWNTCVTDAAGQCSVVIVSNTTGSNTIKAASDVLVGTATVSVETDGTGDNSPPADKDYVGAKIEITPLTADNVVGDPHVLTATVSQDTGGGYVAAANETVTFTVTAGAATFIEAGSDATAAPWNTCVTDAAGQCSVVIVSNTTGSNTIKAASDVLVGTATVSVETDGTGDNSPPADKDYVGAKIEITPLTADNVVGDPHVLTATVSQDTGGGYVAAANETVTFTVTAGAATFIEAGSDATAAPWNTCVTDAAGQCSVVIVSNTTGSNTIKAASDVLVGTATVSVETDGTGDNSPPADKDYVGAKIEITPLTADNVVGDPHVLTATVSQDTGGGYVAAANETVTFTVTAGAATFIEAGSDATAAPWNTCVTDAAGQCSVVIVSNTTGSNTIKAASDVLVGTATVSVETDGTGDNSPPADKDYVGAKIEITPLTADNVVGDPHVLTATVSQDTGGGYVAAANETVTFTVTAGAATFIEAGSDATAAPWNTCVTDAAGQCSVVIVSNTTGSNTIKAASDVLVGTATVSVETDGTGDNSPPADKDYVGAKIEITPLTADNVVGDPHVLTATVSQDTGGGYVAAANETVTFTVTAGAATFIEAGSDATAAPWNTCVTDAAGQCSVVIVSNTTGSNTIKAASDVLVGTATVSVETDGTGDNSPPADKDYVGAKIEITPLTADNVVGDPHVLTATVSQDTGGGYVAAANETVTFTVTAGAATFIEAGSDATAAPWNTCVTDAAGQCSVVIVSNTTGSNTIKAASDVLVGTATVSVETDGTGDNSPPADKDYVGAKIEITPLTADNVVGDPHVLTATVSQDTGGGYVAAANETVTFTVTAGAATFIEAGSDATAAPWNTCVTDAAGQCSVVIVSNTTGSNTIKAASDVLVGTATVSVETDGTGDNSPPADKDYVGAKIEITPLTADNVVGDPHVLTATVSQDTGGGYVAAANETVTFTVTAGAATFIEAGSDATAAPWNTCVTDAAGQCSVVIVSNTTGSNTIKAASDVLVGTATVSVETDGTGDNSPPADKDYVGAKIEITPLTADNVVGDPHVLTATVSQDTGGGYVAAANETVTFTVTAGAATFIEAGSDATAAPWNTCVTDAAGQCSVVIVSNTTGSNTIKAASDVLVGTATVSVETDGTGDNSPPADKDYVGAKIEITPLTADNVVGDPHVLTATVSQDTGGGYVAAANETVTFTVTAGAATFIEAGSDATAAPWNTCVTDAAGQCSVVIVSNTTGSNTIKAASDVLVGTATVSVETDGTGDNSPPADKDYVGAKIEITPLTADNVVGDPHVLTATVSQDTGGGYVAAANETVTFTVTAGAATFIEAGSDATAAPWNTCVTDAAGQCSVVIVSNTTGSNTIKAASDVLVGTATVSVETDGTGDNSPPADKDYVGAKIEITPLTADNVVGDPHVLTATVSQDTGGGYVAAANETVTFTVTAGAATFIEAGSDATAAPWNTCVTDAAGQCSVVIVSNTTGSNTIKAASDVLVGTATVSVETDGTGDNSPPADKDYVGAKIEITPLTADNVVGDPHVLTATVSQDTGGGYVAAANETVTFTVTAGAATFIEAGSDATAAPWNTCVTDAAGQCSVVIVSNTTGSNTIKAASDVLVGTATVSVETDGTGDNSPPADKDYVNARLNLTPETAVNLIGEVHIVTATVEQDTGSGWTPVVDETVTFSVETTQGFGTATFIEAGSDATAAPWNTCVTDAAGQCSIALESFDIGLYTITATTDDTSVEGVLFDLSDTAEKQYVPPSFVTDSRLCTFDRTGDVDGKQFRLLFTPDLQNQPAFKLPASNPGQFYFNTFWFGDPEEIGEDGVTFTIDLPYPFVTQGAMPLHAYTGVTIYEDGTGETCFLPGDELIASGSQVTLDSYNGGETTQVVVTVPQELATEFIYLNIHLDYGLKGLSGWERSNEDAVNNPDYPDIPEMKSYLFSYVATDGATVSGSDTVYNDNEFKRIPGVGGLVQNGNAPVAGARVELWGPDPNVKKNAPVKEITSAVSDDDGWYMITYKHKGKSTEYTVKLVAPEAQEVVIELKGNEFDEVFFQLQ